MKRKLTWKQAWMKLHRAWKKPIVDNYVYASIGNGPSYGMCATILDLYAMCQIDSCLRNSMLNQVKMRLPKSNPNAALYPFTEEGARQRAAFCLRMAKRKEPK